MGSFLPVLKSTVQRSHILMVAEVGSQSVSNGARQDATDDIPLRTTPWPVTYHVQAPLNR